MGTSIIPYESHKDSLLRILIPPLRCKMREKLKQLREWQQLCHSLADRAFSENEKLVSELFQKRRTTKSKTLGVPQDELLSSSIHYTPEEEYRLKKLWKQAANICHPDKGGIVEDFLDCKAAFEAKDHEFLFSFVQSEKTLEGKYKFYGLRFLDCHRQEVLFRQSIFFKIAYEVQKGNLKEAKLLAEQHLKEELIELSKFAV